MHAVRFYSHFSDFLRKPIVSHALSTLSTRAFDNWSRSKNLKPKNSRGRGQFDPPSRLLEGQLKLYNNSTVEYYTIPTKILTSDKLLDNK